MSSAATDTDSTSTDQTYKPPDFSFPAPETPSKNLFSDPNASANVPKLLKRPEADYGQLLEESQKEYRSFEEQFVHDQQQAQKNMQEYAEKAKPLLQSMIDAQLHLNDAPPDIKPDPAIQKEIEAYQQKKPNGVFNIFQLMMVGLALAFSAFGWRRGWGARAGIMEGWGTAFKAFGQGQKDLAQQQADNAYRMQQLVWEENEDRHKQLAEAMANRRLTAEDKARAFNEIERMYGMEANIYRADANITNQHMRTLQNQIRIQKDLSKLQMATHNHLSDFMTQTEPGKQWRAMVMTETIKKDSVTGGRKLDPMRSDEDLAEAEELYPYGEFLDTWKEGIGKPDPSDPSGQKTVKPPAFPKPGQTKSLDEAYDKFGQEFLLGK